MAESLEIYQNYLAELQVLQRKVDGRPIPEAKKQRCLLRLRDLEGRLIPNLIVAMQNGGMPHRA